MTCGKTIYPDKRAAATARNAWMHSHHNRPDHLRIYACRSCNGWHLTSNHGGTEWAKHSHPHHRPHYCRARLNRRRHHNHDDS
ncbi:MAG: hypothetical protein V4726_11220 [Verrucomicrobiota bacterium]